MNVRISLTDRLSVEANGASLDEQRFPGRQGRIVFAYLAAQNGRAVPRDELAELLWGGELPATWEKALRVLMTKLRALLEQCGIDGSTALTSAFGCYKLTLPAGAWIDVDAVVDAVERAEAALAAGDLDEAHSLASGASALARRSFLPGEDGVWVEERRRDLRELLVRSLECLRDASFSAGELAEAVRHAEQVTELEPYRESSYRRLMQAHAAGGNPAEALRVYERCRRFLADALGAYPSSETESIYRGLLEARITATQDAPSEAGVASAHETLPAEAQHKIVTVLFCDVAGLTALDPEALEALLARSRERIQAIAERHGGTAENVVGGAVMAVFGVPVAHEDDALRAVRAAGEMHDALAELGLTARMGVMTGEVLTGTADGLATGDAVNVAKRLQEAANDGAVLIGDSTLALVRSAVDVEPVAPFESKARAQPLAVHRFLRVRDEPERRRPAPFDPSREAPAPTSPSATPGQQRDRRQERHPLMRRRRTFAIALVVALVIAAAFVAALRDTSPTAQEPVVLRGDSVAVIDPDTNAIVTEIPVGARPSGVAAGEGFIWATNRDDNTLLRIDPRSRRVVRTIGLPFEPREVAIVGQSVWVASSAGDVLRVSPAINRVVGRRIRLSQGREPCCELDVATGGGALWVSYYGRLSRIDAATHTVETRRAAGVKLVAYGLGAVWVMTQASHIERIDPDTNEVLDSISLERVGPSDKGGAALAVGAGAVWTSTPLTETLWKIDPATGHFSGRVGLGHHAVGIAFGDDAVWVVGSDRTLVRVDAKSERVVRTIRLGVHAAQVNVWAPVVARGGAVWLPVTR